MTTRSTTSKTSQPIATSAVSPGSETRVASPEPSREAVPGLQVGASLVADPEPPAQAPASSALQPERSTVSGLESGATPPIGDRSSAPTAAAEVAPPKSETASASPAKDPWDAIISIAAAEKRDLDIEAASSKGTKSSTKPDHSAFDSVVRDDEPAADKPNRRARSDRDRHIRHEVTSVREPWDRVLWNVWKGLGPARKRSVELAIAGAEAAAKLIVAVLIVAAHGLKVVGRRLLGAGRGMKSASKGGAGAMGRRMRGVGAGVTRLGRDTAQAGRKLVSARPRAKPKVVALPKAATETQAKAKPKAKAKPRPKPKARPSAPPQVQPSPGLEAQPIEAPESTAGFLPELGNVAPAPAAAAPPPFAEVSARSMPRASRIKLPKFTLPPVLPALRRYWYAPVAVALVAVAVLTGPRLLEMAAAAKTELPESTAPSLPEISMPEVSMPEVSMPEVSVPRVRLPKVKLKVPAFVRSSLTWIGEFLSGPILAGSGERILVADIETDEDPGRLRLAAAMTLVLEVELSQASFFSTVPRERALLALRRSSGRTGTELGLADALRVAGDRRLGVVVAGKIARRGAVDGATDSDSLTLQILDTSGTELFRVGAELSEEANDLEVLAGLTRAVRRRLGEPASEIEASRPASRVLSQSTEAVHAYAQARGHLFAGRYPQAIAAAGTALRHDPEFSAAYQLQAEAYALRGQRRSARAVLELAFTHIERATEREQLRIRADRLAWDGRAGDAVVTYEQLFQRYRDDIGALKAQAVLQRQIGVRGGGMGNLRAAYSMDPSDWPPLSRVARYFNYRGSLPDVDSLIATLEPSP